MNKSEKKEKLMSIDIGNLSPKNVALAMRFMKDLVNGLDTIEEYEHGVSVFGGARIKSNNKYYKAAYKLGHALAKDGHVVVTGGGPGIMEAANKGAMEADGITLGLNINMPTEQKINDYVTDYVSFRYFFARKVMLAFAAKSYVFFPGGIGTVDEVAEILNLIMTKKLAPAPIVLYGKNYWKYFDKFLSNQMVSRYKTAGPEILKSYYITDNISEIVNIANMADKISVDRSAKEYLEQLLRK
jgi:TIGR00730 family protein